MTTTISRLETQNSGKLPFQIIVNPKENASSIVLRSDKELEMPKQKADESSKAKNEQNDIEGKITPNGKDAPTSKSLLLPEYKPIPHFPLELSENKKYDDYKDFYENFHECKVNIPLFHAIKKCLVLLIF